MHTTTARLGVAIAFLTVAACGGAPAPTGAGDPAEPAVDTTEQALTDIVDQQFTPFGFIGGGGGGGPYWLGCGAGQVVAGFFGHSGITTDQLAVVCANLNGDGSMNSYDWPQRWFGGNGGNYFQTVCPWNSFVTGLQINWEGTVQGFWMYCQTAAQIRFGNPNPNVISVVNNFAEYETPASCNAAGWGGWTNPPGPAAVVGFWVKAATYIDALNPICAHLDL